MQKKRNRVIKLKDIHPQLRLRGGIFRAFTEESGTEEELRKQNQVMDRLVTGKWLGKHSKIETKYLTREDGSSLRILVCTSKNGTNPNATGLMWIHGGGYAVGSPEQNFAKVDRFVEDGNTVAVLPDYTRTTEKPYPAALEDCYLTLKWLKKHAEELKVNKDQLFVGGDSAGGALTAAVTLYARDKGEVAIAFQMPLYPMLDDRTGTERITDNDAPVWNSKKNKAAWEMLLRGLEEEEEIPEYAAPARAKDLSNLPPMCTFVGSLEPFLEETITYAKRLKEHGIKVHMRVYKGCFHAFDINCYATKVAKSARDYLMEVYHYAQQNYFAEQKREEIEIRIATEADASALLEIYAYYVEHTAITFDYEVPTAEEFAGRITETLKKYPYLVAMSEGKRVGYAYVSPFKNRAAYDWSVETTVYVHKDKKGLGIGKALYLKLEEILAKQNILNMEACIAYTETEDEYLTNASVQFHEKLGYRMVGEFRKCGYKFNRWYHMVWMEKHIGEHKEIQEEVKTFKEIVSTI